MSVDDQLFPIHVVWFYDDEPDDDFMDLEALGERLEFYDEFASDPNIITTSDGMPLRVLAHDLRVTLLRRVDRPPTVNDLSIVACVLSDGTRGRAELFCGVPHRVISDDNRALPEDPLGTLVVEMQEDIPDADRSSLRAFNEQWHQLELTAFKQRR